MSEYIFNQKKTFLALPEYSGNSATKYVVIGANMDSGVTYRPGTRFGADAIRNSSIMLSDGINTINGKDPKRLSISDAGNLNLGIGSIPNTINKIKNGYDKLSENSHIIMLGGEHTISLGALRSLKNKYDKIGLLHFDAHCDLWESNGELNHGSVFRYAIQEELIDPNFMVQVGLRSPESVDTLKYSIKKGINRISSQAVHKSSTEYVAKTINEKLRGIPVYLSFDIDCLDPSQAPGTGTPEVGGLWTWQVLDIINQLNCNFIGMDMVEVSPPYDQSEITSLAAATIVWHYLSLFE